MAPSPAPRVSVVIETITAREHHGHGPLADEVAPTLARVGAEAQGRGDVEILVVLDPTCRADREAMAARFPDVRLIDAPAPNYFAAKNAGVEAARGDIVALLDADCLPQAGWLDALLRRFEPGVDVVAGRTRYDGASAAARTFSVPDFAHVLDAGGGASGFNINNVAYRRATYLADPLDGRIRRNGGCFFQYHALRRRGVRVVYEPAAVVAHGLDVHGFGFVRKHFDRGVDGMAVYQLDERRLLRGSTWVGRFGPVALVALQARRIALDWARLVRHRRQMGVAAAALPYYCGVCVLTRGLELAGGLAAWLAPRSASPPPAGQRP